MISNNAVSARAEDVARAAYGKLLAILAGRSGDIMAAEDALSDAFVAALKTWPVRGIPDRPEAWLLAVAKNRRIDQARKATRLVVTDEVPDMPAPAPDPDDGLDRRLQLLFVCAHPAIDATLHTPLMLQTVLGLEAHEIARAFMASPTAMAQRLVRAKRKVKAARIPFELPQPEDYPSRMGAVLEAVYGAYAVDWLEGCGDLSHEAFFLSTILADLSPDDPEALGLVALLSFIEARRGARMEDGMLVPVPQQDVNLWDQRLVEYGRAALRRASTFGRMGRFQLEAAIQAVHAARAETGQTDWRALSQLYAGLLQGFPTIGAAVAHAAVIAEDAGPAAALALLDRIDAPSAYQPAYAVRAACLADLGRLAEAAEAYQRAIDLCTDPPSRRWLETKLSELKRRSS
ncbi:MAG: DUF6596 domain-containing protein [Pseudomonadota bacterium]